MNRQQRYWKRRAELEQRSAQLRERLAGHTQAVLPLFQVAEQTRLSVRWLRRHPWMAALGLAFFIWRRPRPWLNRLSLAWSGWKWYIRLRSAWRGA